MFGPFYPRVPFFSRSVHGQQRRAFLTQNYFLQEVLELNFSMSCIIGEIGNDLESDPQTLSTKVLMEILSREKNQGRTDRSTENFIGDRRIIAITVKPRFNEPRYNEDPVITNNI